MSDFFISYRRTDTEAEAGRIADRLRAAVGNDEVFFDTLEIEPGEKWKQRILAELNQARVVLVIIGKTWLTVADKHGQPRLHKADDMVAFEVGSALAQGKRVVPVRVQGAPLPEVSELPAALAALAEGNDHEVRSGPPFDRDVEALIDAVTGRRRGWRRWALPAAGGAALAAALVAGVLLWPADPPGPLAPGPAPAPAPLPASFDMQLQVQLAAATDDPRKVPEMKLWHRRPNPSRASNINLLDQARELARGLLEYLAPIPVMPAQGERYEGLLHRLVLTGEHERPSSLCFIADLRPRSAEPVIRMRCVEGQACTLEPGEDSWARACPQGSASSRWLDWLPAAHAAPAAPTSWALPSLATLQRPDNAGRAYSEIEFETGPLPELREADTLIVGLAMNGQPLHIDGLPPEAYPQRFDAARGLSLRFGLENLDASGRLRGYEELQLELRFMAGDKPLRRSLFKLRYVALRTLPRSAARSDDGLQAQWGARYHPGRVEDRWQIFITSSPDGAGLERHKQRIDQAELQATLGGRSWPLVAVLRPPLGDNASYGLNLALRQPNGQLRFSFDDQTSAALCGRLMALANERPGLVRRDSYRRTLDGSRQVEPCQRFSPP